MYRTASISYAASSSGLHCISLSFALFYTAYEATAYPRLLTIPLPSIEAGQISQVAAPRPLFPIDLRIDQEIEHLAQAVGDYTISSRSTIDILPTARDRPLIQITSGDRPTTPISFIRRLCSIMRAPLSLQYYQSELPPAVQEAVFRYFLSCNGPDGRRLWQNFLDGHHNPQGPRGEVLLQGHVLLWGIFKNGNYRWSAEVDLLRLPITHASPINYSY
ncbi:hypothetical protein K438DRAFT_242045 [Mycena galopus ATCC 62051]|nr:hypothetical protein K438DRAFT_242045 [Mycena galopus ATCC 62051]